VQSLRQLLPPAEIGTAQQEFPMELENLTAGQILSVLENVHSNASDLHEEMGIEYSDALVKVFHDLWTATEN
jgi:hypothetical protein